MSAPGGPASPAADPADGRLARGVTLITLFALAASAVRLVQDAALAWRLGTGPEADAYAWLASLVQWPVAVALATLTPLLAPAEAALPAGDTAARRQLRSELGGSLLLVALLATPLAMLGLHTLAGSPWAALPPEVAERARQGAPWMALVVPLGLAGALWAAWLVAADRRALTLVEALQPLVVALVLWLAVGACAADGACAITWLCAASAGGLLLQAAVQAGLLRRDGGLPRPRLAWRSPGWRGLGAGALWLLAGQMLFALVPLVDTFVASRLGEGQLAALAFASRLLIGAQGVAGLALQRAGLPMFTRLALQSPHQLYRTALRWAWRAGAVALLAAALGALLADPIVALLFERGRFGAADRERVAWLVQVGLLQLPIYAAGLVAVTALAAARATRAMAAVAVAGLAIKAVGAPLLAGAFGLAGLPLSGALMYAGSTAVALVLLRRQVPRGSAAR